MTVLDASAILAYLQGEPGAELVESALVDGAVCGAANWSEVAQKVGERASWTEARALLDSFGLDVVDVIRGDAEAAARRWGSNPTLSLADRLCLALGDRLDTAVLTADRAWGVDGRITQIRWS